MKKNLTISIAAYNVEKYIKETLDSLICKNMNLLEVLIIDDGSKDNTAKIAKKYEEKYKGVFKVISKKNGGYGSTINTGIEYATGKYFKQLDGDDKYDTDNLDRLLLDLNDIDADVLYNPYVTWTSSGLNVEHNEVENSNKKDCKLKHCLNNVSSDLVMHSLAYKTSILKDNKIKILENSFYTDSEYALYPFIYSNTIHIFDYPIYVYRMGDEGQSVSLNGMRKHYLDFEKVINSIIKNTANSVEKLPNDEKKKYIIRKIDNVISISISNLIVALPLSLKNYKYIKTVDKNIKKTANIYYITSKVHKTVYYFRKGKFMIYTLLHIYKKNHDF